MAERLQLEFDVNMTGNLKQELEQTQRVVENVKKAEEGFRAGAPSQGRGVGRGMNVVGEAAPLDYASQQARSLRGIQDQIQYFRSPRGAAIEARRAEMQEELERVRLPRPSFMQRMGGNLATNFGAMGRAAVGLGAPTAAMVALDKVVNKVSNSLDTMNNATMTVADKQEAIIKDLIPLAGTFFRLRDAIMGVTESLRKLGEEHERERTRASAASQGRMSLMEGERGDIAARSNANAARDIGMPGWTGGGFDTSFSGDRGRRSEELRRLEAQANIVRARRGYGAAFETSYRLGGVADRALSAQNAARARALQARSGHQAAVDAGNRIAQDNDPLSIGNIAMMGMGWMNPGLTLGRGLNAARDNANNRVDRVRTSLDASGQGEEFGARQNEAMAARQAADNAIIRTREAEVALHRTLLAAQREELSILDQKEARMSSIQQKLGTMTEAQFELARSAASYIQQHGIGSATQEMIGLAGSIMPDWIRRQGEAGGGRRAQMLAAQFGDRDDFRDFGVGGEDLGSVRSRQNSMQRTIFETADRIEVQFAEVMSTTVTDAFIRAIDQFATRFERALLEFENRLAARNAMGAG